MDCDRNTCFLMPHPWGGVGGEGDKVPLAKLLVTGTSNRSTVPRRALSYLVNKS